jgi:prepilin-type N-terminal cleavage/methylation domain-containing protein
MIFNMLTTSPLNMWFKRAKGFTLVELMVTVFILTVGFSALMEGFAALLYLIDTSREETSATADLRNLLERVKGTSFDQTTARFPNGTVDGPVAARYWTLIGNYTLKNENITVSYTNPATDPLEVRVLLQWRDTRGKNRNLTYCTFKTR